MSATHSVCPEHRLARPEGTCTAHIEAHDAQVGIDGFSC
jgi:hypothetical protein